MNTLDSKYQNLLQDIIDNGVKKGDRTGTGTISVFGRQIRHKMSEGFPLLTTKKMAWKTMVTELLWFLRGDTNIKYLVDNGCHIWDGDAYKKYHSTWEMDTWGVLEPLSKEQFIDKIKTDNKFTKEWGELGPIYGKQWRKWELPNYSVEHVEYGKDNDFYVDQIQNLINDLKTNPDSRRLMVNAWNVVELNKMTLPPCHYGFQVYTRELSLNERIKIGNFELLETVSEAKCDKQNIPKRAISLMWNQRSVDTFLGLPFNIASYGLLLEIIGKIVGMVPDELICNLGDVHLYSNHIEQAKEQIGRNFTPDERSLMLKEAMGHESYQNAINDLVPFGGGMSEYYDIYEIPKHTRKPYPLPKLKLPKTDAFWDNFDVTLFGHLDPSDFIIEDYKYHPIIKAPLSN
jgi:thymidylate synthase